MTLSYCRAYSTLWSWKKGARIGVGSFDVFRFSFGLRVIYGRLSCFGYREAFLFVLFLLSMIRLFLESLVVFGRTDAMELENTSCNHAPGLHRPWSVAVAHRSIHHLYVYTWRRDSFR